MTTSLTFIFDRKKTASVKKTGVVELLIKAFGKRKYISTGVKLHPKEWRNEAVWAREDQDELNDLLLTMKKKVSEILTTMMKEGNLELDAIPNLLRDSVVRESTFLDYAKGYLNERSKRVCDGTKERYQVFINFLEKWGGIVYFADVTEKNIGKMEKLLEKKGLKESTRWNYHKTLKSIILQAIADGLLDRDPYPRLRIKRGKQDGLTRYLTQEEFRQLEKCEIPSKKLQKVRDLFVFQTYTMMGYSDLAAFDYKKCQVMDKQVVYKANRHKTGQEFVIVVLPPAIAILKKYDNKLPIISNMKYNDYLKAVALYAGIDKPISSHWARHTGATMLLNNWQVPMHIIQHMLGHSSIRETEKTYAKVLDSTIVETIGRLVQNP